MGFLTLEKVENSLHETKTKFNKLVFEQVYNIEKTEDSMYELLNLSETIICLYLRDQHTKIREEIANISYQIQKAIGFQLAVRNFESIKDYPDNLYLIVAGCSINPDSFDLDSVFDLAKVFFSRYTLDTTITNGEAVKNLRDIMNDKLNTNPTTSMISALIHLTELGDRTAKADACRLASFILYSKIVVFNDLPLPVPQGVILPPVNIPRIPAPSPFDIPLIRTEMGLY